jgi:hypothetical protein
LPLLDVIAIVDKQITLSPVEENSTVHEKRYTLQHGFFALVQDGGLGGCGVNG